MKKAIVIAMILAGSGLVFADDLNKIPSEFSVTILKIQLDEADMRTQMIQLQTQFQADQARLQHDEDEIKTTNQRALDAAKKDSKEWDVDDAKLEFVGKAKTPAPADKK